MGERKRGREIKRGRESLERAGGGRKRDEEKKKERDRGEERR